MRRIAAVLMLLAGCSSAPRTATPQDPTLARFDHAGDIAFNLEQPGQAVAQYRAALARARTRDDAAAIADAGFNLATAELRAGQPRDALRTARLLRTELGRRGIVDPGFDLISAVALFRLNDLAAADRIATGLTRSRKPALANAAWFLRGLIADADHDRAGLQKAAASLTPTADPGDAAELQARLSKDAALAVHAADLRRDQLDYRGMSRALALAAGFTPGDAEAADLYLRAGRSAAAQGDAADARDWLGKASKLAPDTALRGDAEQALRDLPSR
ncbi:MAG TPA: hypothetical protein VGM32_08780 [Rhodopila sp.]